jgi:hypothetical protein
MASFVYAYLAVRYLTLTPFMSGTDEFENRAASVWAYRLSTSRRKRR